jgi:hypothetical protein
MCTYGRSRNLEKRVELKVTSISVLIILKCITRIYHEAENGMYIEFVPGTSNKELVEKKIHRNYSSP